jgi:peptide/nickel transport system permease protein
VSHLEIQKDSDNKRLISSVRIGLRLISRLVLQVGWFGIFLFMISLISMWLTLKIPGSPFIPTNDSKFNPEVVASSESAGCCQDQPFLIQVFLYMKRIFVAGDWGESITLSEGQPVLDLIWEKLPKSLEIMLVTVLLALPISIIAGKIAGKSQKKRPDNIIGGTMGIFWFGGVFVVGIFLQYLFSYKFQWFPSQGYMIPFNDEIMDHYQVTGFGLIDSLLADKWTIWVDIVHHLSLPIATLFLPTVVMLTWIIRRIKIKIKTKTSWLFFNIYGYLAIFASFQIMFLMVIERVFGINGGGRLFLDAIGNQDYFVIYALVISISGFILAIATFGGIVGIFIDFFRELREPLENPHKPTTNQNLYPTTNSRIIPIRNRSSFQISLVKRNTSTSPLDVVKKWLLNPFIIMSLVLFLLFGSIALITPLFYGKAYLQDMEMYTRFYRPPMLEHPFGSNMYGQDVLGRVLWGFRIPMLLLLLMSIVGGLGYFVGYITNFKKKYLQGIGKFLYSGVFVMPFFILFVLNVGGIGDRNLLWIMGSILFIVYLLMEWAGFYIHNQFRNGETGSTIEYWQRFLKAIPMGLTALGIFCVLGMTLYFNLSYLGYEARYMIEWGGDVRVGQWKLESEPWGAIWPGVAILVFEIPLILWIYGSWKTHVKIQHIKRVILQEI